MLTLAEAERLLGRHLGASSRARHSRFVAYLMHHFARTIGTDSLLWEVTGLCHDLDFDAVAGDWSQHGILAAAWLDGQLPPDALDAIRAHDHRTGVVADTAIAHALELADAVAAIAAELGIDGTAAALTSTSPGDELRARLPTRPWLAALAVKDAAAIGIPLPDVAALLRAAPPAT